MEGIRAACLFISPVPVSASTPVVCILSFTHCAWWVGKMKKDSDKYDLSTRYHFSSSIRCCFSIICMPTEDLSVGQELFLRFRRISSPSHTQIGNKWQTPHEPLFYYYLRRIYSSPCLLSIPPHPLLSAEQASWESFIYLNHSSPMT